jgi:predicted metalloprotease with PDZ domain
MFFSFSTASNCKRTAKIDSLFLFANLCLKLLKKRFAMPKYKFSYKNPLSHFLHVETVFNNLNGPVTLHLPLWRPGRYEIQNFPKRIRGFKVTDNKGKQLPFKKTAKGTWTVDLQESSSLNVQYEYFAGLMDGGNTWLDDEQLYINPVNCCIYEPSLMNERIELEFDLPSDYTLASGLKPNGKHKLLAKSYYQLVDSPIFASNKLRTVNYSIEGYEFYIHIQGDVPQSDQQVIDDFAPFTKKQTEVMGGFPCKHYHFLIQSLPYKAYHGVEHWNSTVICLGPSEDLSKRELYKELLGVSSHELFHTWNVIRMRPKEMTPYNFQGENYHKTGFITEGLTTYYGDLFLIRSGVFSLEEYLGEVNKLLKRHYENEGRKNYSVAESSFDLWLDGYETGIPGRKVSIYNEGALAAMILDLSIRLKFNNEKSLDDVVKALWTLRGENLSGYTYQDYQQVAEEVYEGSLDSYFEKIISGTTPYENYLKELFEEFGLDFKLSSAQKPEERHYGLRLIDGKVVIIAPDSPAEAALSLGDQILKVDGEDLKNEFPNSENIELEIMRMGRKKSVRLESGKSEYFQVYQVQLGHGPNELLKRWLELK